MKIEKPHMIIGIVIIALAIGIFYTMEEPAEDLLTVYVNGIEQPDTKMLEITGETSKYRVTPGEVVTITAEAYNKNEHPDGAYYKVWIYQITDFGTRFIMLETDEVFLKNYDFKVWSGTYKTLTVPSTVTIYVESGTRPTLSSDYTFNDIDYFDIVVESPPTPTPTPTPTSTQTPTPTPTSTPDPCTGITCDPYCEGTTYNYNGYCDNGQCQYQTEYNSAECGYVGPTPTPTPTETEEPGPVTDEDGISGILWLGGGIIGTMAILLFALKAKR